MEIARPPASIAPLRATRPLPRRRGDILAVGLSPAQVCELPARLFGALGKAAVLADCRQLTADRLTGAMAVLSPLVGPGFDAVDIALLLDRTGFVGYYFAFTQPLPNPQLVIAEVSAMAPLLSFEVVEVGATPHLVR
jgi:hypothetical protein